MNEKPVIGIVGGTGKMGQLFKRIFEEDGFKVLISGRKTELTGAELAKQSNIIIFSVPIEATPVVVKEVAPHAKKGSLLTDFTSLKVDAVKAMLEHAPEGVEVVGMHPQFGPNVSSLKGLVVVLNKARGEKWFNWLKDFFEKKEAVVEVTTPKEHDELMAVAMSLRRVCVLPIAHSMNELKIDLNKSLKLSSPGNLIQFYLMGRILSEDAELNANVLLNNPNSFKILRQYLKSVQELEKIIEESDKEKFKKYFNKCQNYVGSFKENAREKTNFLIEKLKEK